MADSTLHSSGGATKRRGVSSIRAFVVVAAATFAVLSIAMAERETVYEADVTIRVAATPVAESPPFSPREISTALFGLFDATPDDELVDHGPDETNGQPPEENDKAPRTATMRDKPECRVAVRSRASHRLAERLNDAARRFVEVRNIAAAKSVERELATLRDRTEARREEREAAARRVAELESAESDSVRPRLSTPADTETAPSARARNSEDAGRALNPQWVLLRDEVSLLEGKLAELRGRFTEQHPEVQHALGVLAERSAQFKATPQYADGGSVASSAMPEEQPMPGEIATPANPPLTPPHSEDVVDAPRDLASVQEARDALAAADAALNDAWNAEKAAAERQVEVAANGPWRFEPAEAVRAVGGAAANGPWLAILGVSLAAGLAASMLARGLAPIIESPEDAVAALGLKVVGIVRTDDPLPPRPADPGVVSARWLVRGGAAVVVGVAVVATLAASGAGMGLDEVRRDPTVLLSLSRDWLAERLG